MRRVINVVLVIVAAGFCTAWADSNLHIGPGAGTSCAKGCAGEPNLLGTGSDVDIYLTSGSGSLNQPVFLILGVPNDTTDFFTTDPISSLNYYASYPSGTPTPGNSAFATKGTYGLKGPVADGFFGDMTKGSIYSFLDLNGPTNNSNSFKNWAAADFGIDGITAADFGIYVFALSGEDLAGKGLIDILFPGGLPLGTFVVAYGESGSCKHLKIYDTPFTESGMTNGSTGAVPEPGSLLLLGSGLLLTAILLRRRATAMREALQRFGSR